MDDELRGDVEKSEGRRNGNERANSGLGDTKGRKSVSSLTIEREMIAREKMDGVILSKTSTH